MGREEWLLAESIAKEIERAEHALHEVDGLQRDGTASSDDPEDDRYERAEKALAYYIDCSFRSIAALADRLGIGSIAEEARTARGRPGFLSSTERPYDGEIFSDALSQARSCFNPLRAMTTARAVTAQDVLRTILRSTGKIVADRGLTPKNEAEVRNEVLDVCRYAFADAKRETPIFKRITHYKADVTVQSLRAVVEFKFVDDRAEMKAALDGVYADMKGYKDMAWESFYSVFYMTGPFFTQQEIEEEFRYVDADKMWEPILIVGPGGRVKKAKT